ncbi:MAG: DUF4062 domain-containing protein [Deltaproteobacteria bacterium]|nr:DUF4062 domain-containing protein [Deltaproteobacteria bacterium]
MTTRRIFISSVQREFAEERRALRQFVERDALLGRFFSVFLFEDLPATDRRVERTFLDAVERSDIYVGLFGKDYGSPDRHGVSPTEKEFDRASSLGKPRLVFVKDVGESSRHPRMAALVAKAEATLVRRAFATNAELIAGLYAALVRYLVDLGLVRTGPFDAAPCATATLADIDPNHVRAFVEGARQGRGFPLTAASSVEEVLTHLHLLSDGQPTNAAVLLFGRSPQRWLLSSAVKCAHFHGTEVTKPIPSYQVYKGTAFELVDQAVDFVLSKLDLAVGTRARSTRAPVAYEIPMEAVREAIVNAVAHRDYASSGGAQVMLFRDRLEIWNPGTLPPSLSIEQLRRPHGSVPGNPLLAEALYLARYIERMGTGIRDMIARCRKADLPEPRFSIADGFTTTLWRGARRTADARPPAAGQVAGQVTGQVTGQVAGQVEAWIARVLATCVREPQSRQALQDSAGIRHRETFQRNYLDLLLARGLIERTIPGKPTSRLQRYRITRKGRAWLARHPGQDPA